MKKCAAFGILVVFSLCISSEAVFAQRGGRSQGDRINVRLASPMPSNSDWGRTLNRIANEWRRVTNDEVRLIIQHDGLEGGEGQVLSSLRSNHIQAALFTSFGLSQFIPAVMTLSVPFLISNDAELDLVLQHILPLLEEQINRTEFVVIAWSKGGWVNVFSRDPVFTPDELRRHRVATSPESEEVNTTFRTMGFNLIEVDVPDLATRLSTGAINALYQSPAAVVPNRLHLLMRNMMDMPIAPFIGAVVMNRVTWNRIGAENQREILRATRHIAVEFDAAMPRTVDNALREMQRDGLTINRINSTQEALWRADVNRAMPSLLGTTFDPVLYRRISEILTESRGR